jgi:lipoprotein signal peptidase
MDKKIICMTVSFCILLDQMFKIYIANVSYLALACNSSYLSQDVFLANIASNINIVLIWNQGIIFGALSKTHDMLLQNIILIFTITIVILIAIVYVKQTGRKVFFLYIIPVGIVGNLTDRVVFGGVIDFISLHYKYYYWPIFNIADMFAALAIATIINKNQITKLQ